jgi:hypothetical protein
VGTLCGCTKEGGWDTGVGRYVSICPNSRILIENPLANKAGQKKLAKSELGKLTSMEKYTQLLLTIAFSQAKNLTK